MPADMSVKIWKLTKFLEKKLENMQSSMERAMT